MCISAFGQKADRWKDLILDKSTPENAIATLGSPKSDKNNLLPIIQYKWMTKSIRNKNWRVLHYENVTGFKDVKLGFDQNAKLVFISLEPKEISAQSFISSYEDLEFRFANEVMSPADFKNSRENSDKPKNMAAVYILVSVTDNAFVFGGVGNSTGNVMSTLFGNPDTRQSGRSVPGKCISSSLLAVPLKIATAVRSTEMNPETYS